MKGCYKPNVNATIHLKVFYYSGSDDKVVSGLVQITDYYGQQKGGLWRVTGSYKGIIGRCLRTKKSEWVNFTSDNEYEERMVKEFGFTVEEMQSRTSSARSYWAQPIFKVNEVVGVLYLFTPEMQVFPRAANINTMESNAKDIAALLSTARII